MEVTEFKGKSERNKIDKKKKRDRKDKSEHERIEKKEWPFPISDKYRCYNHGKIILHGNFLMVRKGIHAF